MAIWRYAVGNAARRAANAPVAVSPAVEDTVLTLDRLADDQPDTLGAFQWRGDGVYAADFDLNMLADSSDRSDAPTGLSDLLNLLAGTPGLPANPAAWGNYGGRNPALLVYRPSCWDVEVMPGVAVALSIGLYWPASSSGATGVRVRVMDLSSGLSWDEESTQAWTEGGIAGQQLSSGAWADDVIEIAADPNRTERATYRVIIEPIASSYGATTAVYASVSGGAGAPALYPEIDLCAIIGHNLPDGATVQLEPQPSGTAIVLTPALPSCYGVAVSTILAQVWRLTIQQPSGWHAQPKMGEVWIGQARSFNRSPDIPIQNTEGDDGQIRIEGAGGRLEVLSDQRRPTSAPSRLLWKGPAAEHLIFREELTRGTRFGAEPMLLFPGPALDGAGVVYMGRPGKTIMYSRMLDAGDTEGWRSWTFEFGEAPFAAP